MGLVTSDWPVSLTAATLAGQTETARTRTTPVQWASVELRCSVEHQYVILVRAVTCPACL